MRLSWSAPWLLAGIAGVAVLNAQTTSPDVPPRATHVAAGARQLRELREWDRRVDALVRSGALASRTVRRDTVLTDGRLHERFDQYYKGVRVVGGDIVRQARNGVTESIFGTLHGAIALSTEPKIDADAALARMQGLADPQRPPRRAPELVVLATGDARYALAWRAHLWTGTGWMHTFLDANDGSILLQYNDLQTQSAVGTGYGVLGDRKKISTRATSGGFLADDQLRPPTLITYDAQGDLSRALALLDGLPARAADVASDTDNDWADAAVVDAHVHLGWTYDFLFKRFGRRGLDDRNAPVRAITHPVRRNDVFTTSDEVFGTFYLNAFWCDECGPGGSGMMMFGEGLPGGVFLSDGKYYDYFAGALDIVAHELAHAVTSYSSALIYRNESGALNESFSDIIGTSTEFFFHSDGNAVREADYLIGEDISRPGGDRSMADPGLFGDPDHYSRRYLGPLDNGGVHTNSGISNHAFYLAIQGGTNRTSGLAVQGVGAANREQIEKVFYRAFVFMLPSNATFSTARAATIQSARELYGANSAAERAVTQAWTAVGVF
jgi:bacillolysin